MFHPAGKAAFRLFLAILLSLSWSAPGWVQSASSAGGGAANAQAGDQPWPRSFETPGGGAITLHQPQVTAWKDFTSLTALIAAEYTAAGSDDPAFGVIEVTADTSADRETDEVTLSGIAVTNINFSTLPRNAMSDISLEIGQLLPTAPITFSLTRMTASLENYERLQDTKNIAADAPSIFVSQKPAILLQTNGKVTTAPVRQTPDLVFVINTNWDVLIDTATRQHFLRDGKSWLMSKTMDGPWSPVTELPALLSGLPDDDNWKEAHDAVPPQPFGDGMAPRVYYSDRPAELIVIDGEPALQPVPGTGLEWVSNANSDVFFDAAAGTWYFLTAGRWFSAANLQGPWSFASQDLPVDFRKIPAGEPYSLVRASVPGTSESDEARLLAAIPTTARVDRAQVTVDVTYFGDPEFVGIAGTDLAYAVNTQFTVIRVGDRYFVVHNGVWFVGDTPTGPFAVADTVPDPVYDIPPASPVYNVTYVRVYDSTPTHVTFGYTSGYLWAFLAWGTFVYGTGYYYPPYWVYRPGYPPIYRPWRVTYGSGTYYLPGRGTFTAHWGRAYGPYGGISAGGIYNRNTGGYIRGARAWGPYNHAGYVSVRGPGGNKYWVADINGNIYKSWDRGVTTTNSWAKRAPGEGAAGRWQNRDGAAERAGRAPDNGLVAGRDGSVFRQHEGKWQEHRDGKWSGIRETERKQGAQDRGAGTERSTRVRDLERSLGNQRAARQRAEERTRIRRSAPVTERGRLQRPTTRNFERRRR